MVQKDQVYTLSMQYDGAGRRTQMSWGDDTDGVADAFITYDYDATGAMKTIREGGVNALATFAYDDLGRRALLTRGNGVKTSYGYTGPNLSSLGLDLSGTSNDQTYIYGYNAAGQLVSRTGSNEAYAWTGHVETGRGYTANALNQYTQAGSIVPTYDARGNLTSGTAASTPTYAYNVNNALVTSRPMRLNILPLMHLSMAPLLLTFATRQLMSTLSSKAPPSAASKVIKRSLR